MKKPFLILMLLIFSFSLGTELVQAHSGRTDSCGGHNDRKHGGYHVHNLTKYCTCYPDAPECKKSNEPVIEDKGSGTHGVMPIDEWNCPDTHPIKGNINVQKGTMIFHLPGGAYYTRTKPEKCYATEQDAIADGFRKSKR